MQVMHKQIQSSSNVKKIAMTTFFLNIFPRLNQTTAKLHYVDEILQLV